MAHIEVYGCSDDLIEVDGDIRDEHGRFAVGQWSFVVFSDGTVLRVGYSTDKSGNWRVERIREGAATFNHVSAELRQVEDEDEYSDVGVLDGPIEWVKFTNARSSAVRMGTQAAGRALASKNNTTEG